MKEEWIDNVMASVDSKSKVLPDSSLMERLKRIPQYAEPTVFLKKGNWFLLAGLAAIIVGNSFVLWNVRTNESSEETVSTSTTYFDYINSDL